MGRKTGLQYPPDSANVQRSEAWRYDTAGRNDTFTNRAGDIQTMTYGALNRKTGFSWNDGGLTPSVTFGYDVASRMTSVTNANATISRTYFNDNLLNTETTTYADNKARTVTYSYDADGNRATIQYPNGVYSFTYNYTNRNQLQTLVNNSNSATVATYGYDPDGNLTTRTPNNTTSSTYTYDALDRVTHISHVLNGTTRTFDYAYDSVSNRKWTQRDGGTGDVFGYDQNDQAIAILLNVANPDTTAVGSQTIKYDANGNRTTFSAYGPTDTYTTNELNQYTARNSSQATYDHNGNMTTGLGGSTYTYDAQNRLLTATTAGTADTFTYDGLNRQVSRKIGTASPVYKVYDGWDLIAEYPSGATSPSNAYLAGAGGLVKNMSTGRYYYQDASGSTSHLADSSGHLLEWYRYDLQGTPLFYNASNTRLSASAYGIRHLFTGQQWYSDIGLYDLRNRFYLPDVGRFLQGDPIGFGGDPTNLYRYCGNNPLKRSDPTGLFPIVRLNGAAPLDIPSFEDLGYDFTSYDAVGIFGGRGTNGGNAGNSGDQSGGSSTSQAGANSSPDASTAQGGAVPSPDPQNPIPDPSSNSATMPAPDYSEQGTTAVYTDRVTVTGQIPLDQILARVSAYLAGKLVADETYRQLMLERASGIYRREWTGPIGRDRHGYTKGSVYHGEGVITGGPANGMQGTDIRLLPQHLPPGSALVGYGGSHLFYDRSLLQDDAAKFEGYFGFEPVIVIESPGFNQNFERPMYSCYPNPSCQ